MHQADELVSVRTAGPQASQQTIRSPKVTRGFASGVSLLLSFFHQILCIAIFVAAMIS